MSEPLNGFSVWNTQMQALLLILRSSFLVQALKGRPLLWLDKKVNKNCTANVSLILGALVNSRSPRYSERLLSSLAVLPRDVLESHPALRSYFLNSHMPASTVYEAIKTCQEAIRLCFSAK